MTKVPDAAAKARAALLGALPVTRMVDTGMEVGAALRLVDAVTGGADLDIVAEAEADALLARLAATAPSARLGLRLRAIGSLVVAQLAFNSDTDRKRALYARITAEVAQLAVEHAERYRVVAVPFLDATLSGILVLPEDAPVPGTVVLFGGLNGWGAAYLGIAEALREAGLACLLVELPGQGTARLDRSLFGGRSVVPAISACVDWIVAEPALGAAVGVWGNSFGGLFAALAAADDQRIAAACINGAPATPTVPPFRTALDLMFAFFGVDTAEDLLPVLTGITFEGAGRTIGCPVLVLHGGRDALVREADQRPFLEAGSGPARWQEWADGQHTMYNHTTERNAIAATWFADALGAGPGIS